MNGFDYYMSALKKYADFSGRSRRSEYWYFALFNFLFAIGAVLIDGLIGMPILYFIYILGTLIPGLAVLVRRLHDTNRSGWWFLIALVPLVGGIVLLVFLATDSDPNENQYGLNPKDPTAIDDDISRHLVE
jgi:uncharacterized membrane protein YhaH (DUF805 family)